MINVISDTPRLSDYGRARRYLVAAGPAVQGSGGYKHTGAIVWALVCKWDLTDAEVLELLDEWNRTCDPPWAQKDLAKAVERARRHSYGHTDGYTDAEQRSCPQSRRERDRLRLRHLTSLPPEQAPVEADAESLEPLRGIRILNCKAGRPGADYLSGRGIPLVVARAAGVLYHPALYGRPAVLFPVRDLARRLVAATARYIDGQTPKARTAGPKGAGVFWTPGALSGAAVIIVEGPMDALSLAVVGYPALALMGTTWPAWLPGECAWKRVLLATDADDAGDRCAAALEPAMRATGARPERLTPSPAKDWSLALEWYGPARLRQALSACDEKREE